MAFLVSQFAKVKSGVRMKPKLRNFTATLITLLACAPASGGVTLAYDRNEPPYTECFDRLHGGAVIQCTSFSSSLISVCTAAIFDTYARGDAGLSQGPGKLGNSEWTTLRFVLEPNGGKPIKVKCAFNTNENINHTNPIHVTVSKGW